MVSRALPIAVGLVAADYAVWTWATGGERVVPAVVTGLALPPLAIALAWVTLLAVLAVLRRGAAALRRRLGPVPRPWRSASAGAGREEQQADRGGEARVERRIAA